MKLKHLILSVAVGLLANDASAVMIGELIDTVRETDVTGHPDFRYRHNHVNLYLKDEGDYNGDGIRDLAFFSKNETGDVAVSFVLRGSDASPFEKLPTGPISLKNDMPRMGLKTVKPGIYKTACSKGYGKARTECVRSVMVKHDAIEVFTFEAASTLYVWNGKAFDVYPLSD